ncbi:MAG: DNA polymerase III subunit alpha, partial [bacterium]|nr:DNA polymerase III subunit alpha [bacterium]
VIEDSLPEPTLPNVPEWSDKEKLVAEKEMLGFWVTGHPLDEFRDKIDELATHSSESIQGLSRGTEVVLCGVLTTVARKRNREGKPFAAVQLEDRQGWLDGVVFTTVYEQLAESLTVDQPVLISGSALPEEGAPTKVSIKDIVPLENARIDLPRLISIRVPIGRTNGDNRAGELNSLFERKRGDAEVRL